MTLKVWDESCKNDTDKDIFYLILKKHEDDNIHLHFCDKEGKILKSSHVLQINENYRCIILMHGLNDKFPLKLQFLNIPLVINDIDANQKMHDYTEQHFKDKMIDRIKESLHSEDLANSANDKVSKH